MKKEPIISFEGMSFDRDRRARLPKSRGWQTRRKAKNQLGVSHSVRTVFQSLFGM